MVKELTIRKPVFWGVLEHGSLAELLGLRTSSRGDAMTGVKEEWVEIFGYGCLFVALSFNFVGDTCLRINLLTKRALAQAADGDVIEIITDNLSSVETIPFMSPNYNGMHLATCQDAQCWRIYIQKEAAMAGKEVPIDGSHVK
jgi:tRNA 2-thiouridine synthesizing protein A